MNNPSRKKQRVLLTRLMLLLLGVAGIVASEAARGAPEAAAKPGMRHSAFITVLLRNWDKWDRNSDGVLTPDEIDRALLDPQTRGEDAAAAATLKIVLRQGKVTLPPLDRAYFGRYESDKAVYLAGLVRTHAGPTSGTTETEALPGTRPGRPAPDWDLEYRLSRSRIEKARSTGMLWPESGFDLQHMRQGPLGDCYFVSVVGAVVARNPADVQKMVSSAGEGRYTVSFPGTQPVTVGPLTDGELAVSSATPGEGIWLAILEQGFGLYREKVKPPTTNISEATDVIAHGGTTGSTITALTGHPVRVIRFASTLERRDALESEVLGTLRRELISATREHRLVTANTPATQPASVPGARPATQPVGTRPVLPPGMTQKHAYAVLAYDAASDVLELWNPHGQTYTPKGEPGLANGYVTKQGRFKVELREAYRFLSSIVIEK